MKRVPVLLALTLLTLVCSACGATSGPTSPGVTSAVLPAAPVVAVPAPVLYTLSGVISEMTPAGLMPVEGVRMSDYSCDTSNKCGLLPSVTTDRNGFYSISGANAGKSNWLWAEKQGYMDSIVESPPCDGGCHTVTINGDTRYDIQLVRP